MADPAHAPHSAGALVSVPMPALALAGSGRGTRLAARVMGVVAVVAVLGNVIVPRRVWRGRSTQKR